MIEYIRKHPEKVLGALTEHIELVLITLVISLAIACLLTLLAMRSERVSDALNNLFSVLYSVPSLALFALLIPVTGLGRTTAVIVLTLYNQYILLRSFTAGLRDVDPAVCEAAKGIGMTDMQILTKIRVPLARRAIFAGIRLAVVSTIGIGTIAASINAGGLGTLLFEGLRTINTPKILWGSVLSALLAVSINKLLKMVENRL
ncbi:MAG: ABC transporter permease [Lachnospiraceae bacterium]|nr:ABC transporter permease [Lachnospiraceae bacterium]